MTISRRRFGSGTGVAALGNPNLVFAQGSGRVRVGLPVAKTGPLASGGIDMKLALTMFLRERDYTVAGRKIDLITPVYSRGFPPAKNLEL
jgi:branched-chain amino acid transport system substrate-binding protein